MGRKTESDLNQIVNALSALLTPVQTIATQSAIKTVTVSGSVNTAAEGAVPLPPTLTLSNNTVNMYGSISYPTLNFTSSAFAYIGATQTLSQIQMQISTDSGFGTVVATLSVGTSTTFTLANTDYQPSSKGWFSIPADLTSANVLWFRIRHFNSSGYASSWSASAVLNIGNFASIDSAKFVNATSTQRIILGNSTSGTSGSSTTWSDYTGQAIVCAIGGGGAASGDDFTSGAGGGGSGYVGLGIINVTPSMAFTYVTGARGYDMGDAGTGAYSAFNANSYTAAGSSSITINGTTITGAGGGQAFLRTSSQCGGSGGSGGGGYGSTGGNGGNGGANGGGSNGGVGSGSSLASGGGGAGGSSDDGGKYSSGAGGAGFCITHAGIQGTAQGGGNRTSGRGGGIGAGGGGKGRDSYWDATQMRGFAGGVVLIKKYW